MTTNLDALLTELHVTIDDHVAAQAAIAQAAQRL
ncbi:hypothetical protein MGAST_16820 [Mycobacterium gastri 'Wayne']|nr:hypothetical protein MGAST_16820 [Mycobacterium gastri 'Wayne']